MEKSQFVSNDVPKLSRMMTFLIIQMILLVLQFITGIIENKYPQIAAFTLFGIQYLTLELLIHVVAGFVIVILGLLMIFLSFHIHSRTLIVLNLIAPIFTGLAIHAGAEYFLYTFDPAYSVWMAICYIVVFLAYCLQAHRVMFLKKAVSVKPST